MNNNLFAETVNGVIYRPTDGSEPFWLPDVETVKAFESVFSPFLQERLNSFARIRKIDQVPNQKEYVRQYFGTYKDNKKVLMIRGHRNSNPDLKKLEEELFFILDGSWYLFTVYFDPDKGEISNFSFNDGSN
ncbi:MAG TPA: hypothetical protein PKA63_01485 [Oligoflexia bacterium]|nr:hypothetical protein [Oligoflexia bacterium]HMP47321.1 hypothetical protein [Oligoflexia bacterium]